MQGQEGGLGKGEGRQDERKTEERRRKGEEERTAMRKQISLTKRRRTRSLYTTQTFKIDHLSASEFHQKPLPSLLS